MGRKSKSTEEAAATRDRIAKLSRDGVTTRIIASRCGVGERYVQHVLAEMRMAATKTEGAVNG